MLKWKFWQKPTTEQVITSPNGRIKCLFRLKNNQLTYQIFQDGEPIVKPSRLGLDIAGETPIRDQLNLVRTTAKRHHETIELPWGEDREIPNNYEERAFYLAELANSKRIFTLRFRVFDDGVAFRYELPAQPKFRRITIKDELTEFNVDQNSTVYSIPAYQPDRYEYNYEKSTLFALDHPVHTPFTIKTPSNHYLSVHEAALYNYGSMNLKLRDHVLASDITPLSDHTKAHVDLPFQTPWRLIMIANSAPALTHNRLIYALNDPPKQDFSWVKPLKFLGIWWAMYVGEWTWAPGENHGATTKHAKEYIDACVRLGLSGLLVEGWNEGTWEGDWLENGAKAEFTNPTSDFNLPEVARYASLKGVELIGHHETVGFVDNYENQLEKAYNYYAANNVHYIKTGYAGAKMFINGHAEFHHSQLGINHYQKTVELAARKKICLDIHEPIKGTGIERTFPNLLTREGARGQEYEGGSLEPSHACFLPYTRLLAGGMDYTPGILDLQNPTKSIKTTLARQLAYFVTIYSGMTMAADRPFIYEDRYPELYKFIRDVPVNFEKTKPLQGEIGEYYVVARQGRDDKNWYLGGVTNGAARRLHLNLDFLNPGATYEATIYQDAENAHYEQNPFAIEATEKHVIDQDFLDLYMAPGGGFAVKFRKIA